MQCDEIWLSRHGVRIWQFAAATAPPDVLLETPPFGDDDSLSPHGEQQAVALAECLGEAPIAHIFSSPFRRTIQTVAPLARRLGLPIKLEWGLCEFLCEDWFEAFPQLPSVAERHDEFPEVDVSYRSLVMPQYPETTEQQRQRVAQAVETLTQNYGPGIFLMGHAGIVNSVRRALLPNAQSFVVDFCGVTHLKREGDSWHALREGDVEHLKANQLHVPWPPPGLAEAKARLAQEAAGKKL